MLLERNPDSLYFFNTLFGMVVLSKFFRIMTRERDAPSFFFALIKGFYVQLAA